MFRQMSYAIITTVLLTLTSFGAVSEVTLDHVDGLDGASHFMSGQSAKFYFRATNTTATNYIVIGNGFRVYSPDGASWSGVVGDTIAVNSSVLENTCVINYFGVTGTGSDTVGFGGSSLLSGLYSGFDDIAYAVEIGPFSVSDTGKTVCIDSTYFPNGALWFWGGSPSVIPDWDGPHCYSIAEGPPPPPGDAAISLDHVDGLDSSNNVVAGDKAKFYFRATNTKPSNYLSIANGFRIYSPDGAEWTDAVGDTIAIGQSQFELGFSISNHSVDGVGADTVGFGGVSLFAGLGSGFDDLAYSLELGPFRFADTGKTICIDSSYFPPTGSWLWSGPPNAVPDWDGPHCYTIVRGSTPPPGWAQVELDYVAGLNDSSQLQVGQTAKFFFRVTNTTATDYIVIGNGFRVYSPDGAGWSSAIGDTINIGQSMFEGIFVINYFSANGSGADTVGFGGASTLSGLYSGYSDIAYSVEIGPFSIADTGKTVCIDSTYFPIGVNWFWGGTTSVVPEWDGPHCYTVAEASPPPPGDASITLDHVDGLNGSGNVMVGQTARLHFRATNTTSITFGSISNGFRVYSPDGADWTNTVGDTLNISQSMFEVGVFINDFSVTGSGADTIGFAAVSIFGGIFSGFDEQVFAIEIGPFESGDVGKTVCVDSSYYRPVNQWFWGGPPNVTPDWDGPHCFTVADAPGPPPGVAAIALDHVDGLDSLGEFQIGQSATFHFRATNSTPTDYRIITNGFRVYSPDGADWTDVKGDTLNIGQSQFERGFFINDFSVTGSGADTVGFAGVSLFDGLLSGFDDLAYSLEIGPFDSADAGKMICIDSAFYPPGNSWFWGAPPNVTPDWDGPHCYRVSADSTTAITLDYVDGLSSSGNLIIGQKAKFYFRATNHSPDTVHALDNGFRIYSPDGAGWTGVVGDTLGFGRDLFDLVFVINYFSADGFGSDTVGFGGASMVGGMPPGYDDIALSIELGPFETDDRGKTVCIDSSYYPPGGTWRWVATPTIFPDWYGPHCFQIGEDPPPPVEEITLDHMDGVDNLGMVAAGQSFTLYLRITSTAGATYSGISNGFRIYSPDGASWSNVTGDTLGIGKDLFDPFEINYIGVNGSTPDIVGFRGVSIFNGLYQWFDTLAYSIEIGPVDYGSAGKTICVDSTYFPGNNRWLWGGSTTITPDWDGPHCFTITACCVGSRGNVDGSASKDIDITDLTYLVAYMYGGGPNPPCMDEADINGVSPIDVSDLTHLVAYMFGGGPAPAACP